MYTHDERQWEGLKEMMARSTGGEVAIPKLEMVAAEETMEEEPVAAFQPLLGQGWGWSCTAPEMAAGVGVNWCPTPPRSPEREASPREEVVQAPLVVQPAPRPPRTVAPPLDAAGVRRPRQRRRRHRRPVKTATATAPTGAAGARGRSFFILFLYVNYKTGSFKWPWKLGRFVADPYICFMFF